MSESAFDPKAGPPDLGRKFTLLALAFCVLFLGFLIYAYSTFEEVRINGPIYHKLALERDFVADLLPPPEQLIEPYLVVLDALQDPTRGNILQAIQLSRKLTADLESRQRYWSTHLPDGPLKKLLTDAASGPARRFSEMRDGLFFPALRAGDLQAAARLARGPLKSLYLANRVALDQTIVEAREGILLSEQATATRLRQRSWWLAGLGIACVLTGAFLFGGLFFSVSVAALRSVVSHQKRKLAETEDELTASRLLLQTTFDHLPLGVHVKDLDGRYVMVNRTMANRWETDPSQIIGKSQFDLKWTSRMTPEERAISLSADEKVLETGIVVDYELDRALPKGRTNLRFLKAPIRDVRGRIYSILTLSEDVTEKVRAREELQRSQQLLQTIFDTIPHIVIVKDLESRYVMVNKTWQSVIGYEAKSAVGKLPSEIPGRNAAETNWITERNRDLLFGQDGTPHLDFSLTDQHGSQRTYHSTRSLLRDSAGAVIGSVAVGSDVTEERLANERVRKSQSQLQDAIECMPAGFFLFDANERLLTWNSRVIDYFGHAEEVLRVGVTCEELLRFSARSNKEAHGREEAWVQQRLEHFRKNPGIYYEQNLDDGRCLHGIEHRTSDGGTVSLRLDISDRKHAERAARKSESLLQSVFDTVPEVLSVKTLDGKYLAVNKAFLLTWGIQEDRVVGGTARILNVSPETAAQVRSMELAAVRTGEIQRKEPVQFQMPSGETRYYRMVKAPLYSEEGVIMGTVGSSEDITERWLAREKERSLQEQLQHAQKLEVVGRLAAGVAHDFNNLLTPIIGYAEIGLAEIPAESGLRVPFEQILEAGSRASELTRALLAFGRKQILDTRNLDLRKEVGRVLPMMRRLIGSDIEIRQNFADTLSHVLADSGQVHQVLMNLIVNARDAMPEGGTITISIHDTKVGTAESGEELPVGDYVAISIADTGCGMDATTQARIFEPFFTTKEQGKGTGLGLAIVYGIVKQHGASIRVDSVPGVGTKFSIYFPASKGYAAMSDAPALQIQQFKGSESVLVVDDEPLVRTLVSHVLRTQGYQVHEAADPDAAFELVRAGTLVPAIVVTDLVMPKMSGLQLYRRLAASIPELKVLFISGHPQDALQDLDWRDVSPRILRKPFSVIQLAEAVRAILDSELGAANTQSQRPELS